MAPEPRTSTRYRVLSWLILAAALYVLLVAVGVVGKGFRLAFGGAEGIGDLFEFATTIAATRVTPPDRLNGVYRPRHPLPGLLAQSR